MPVNNKVQTNYAIFRHGNSILPTGEDCWLPSELSEIASASRMDLNSAGAQTEMIILRGTNLFQISSVPRSYRIIIRVPLQRILHHEWLMNATLAEGIVHETLREYLQSRKIHAGISTRKVYKQCITWKKRNSIN